LVGAGSDRTTISGGGPVLTIGTFGAASEPTVTIDGVAITGGVTRSSWATGPGDGVFALGGGVRSTRHGFHHADQPVLNRRFGRNAENGRNSRQCAHRFPF